MNNLKAMWLMLIGMACFSSADGIIKFLSVSISKGQIMTCMGLAGAVVFYLLCRRKGTTVRDAVFFHPVLIIRNIAEIVAALAIFTALSLAPLSSVAAILQAVPLVITLCAAWGLKEKVGPRRWAAIIVGFIGVLIIVRPNSGSLDVALLLAVLGMVSLSIRDLASRLAPPEASTPLLSFYAFSGLIPTGLILSALTDGFDPINGTAALILLAMSALALTGYLCVTIAMRIGEVSAVSPLRYARLPFAAVVGFLLFAEVPDAATLFGSALVIGSGLFVMLREAQISRAARGI
ncbi:DMT family transporter [Cognatishimia sp. SS12]|uniref:DMT family transporter n=1 Tax=Cognatishimia sp. SS12 TaxID=2979465 RepID=UPI00232CAFFE|nr:DMT family transporter [Cognatishimia sp. SS12]MDC0737323.1 DMT family transporter [Cognatishimia sp. SS12]